MIIRTEDEYNKVKSAAKYNNDCILYLKSIVEPGITGEEVDKKAEEYYKKHNLKLAFKGYHGYPATINFMINDQVIHCIPNKNQVVAEGDIVSIDTGCIYEGYYGDMAISFGVGEIDENAERLLNIARTSVEAGSKAAIAGARLGDIGNVQQTIIELAGFNVVREFVGHEIGKNLHDEIQVPSYGVKGKGIKLPENILLCIENQVNEGKREVYVDKYDGWSTYTKDGSRSATFEHMVIARKGKVEVLTRFS